MNRVRRGVALVLLVISVSSAALGWQAMAAASAEPVEDSSVLPLLSPRRTPELGAEVGQEAALRKAITDIVGSDAGGTCVEIRRDGRPVFATNASRSFIPASTTKILTASVALAVFGADHRFRTTVESSGKVEDGAIDGPLYLVGGGDPLLSTDAFVRSANGHRDIHSSIETLADDLVAKGLRRVNGGVVGDDSLFDQQRYLPSWEPGYRTSGQVGPISALSVDQGFAMPSRVAVENPAVLASTSLTDLLRRRGVDVRDEASAGRVPSNNKEIVGLDSVPLRDIVREMLTESDNTTAEILLKHIGVRSVDRGTFTDGSRSVVTNLRENGYPVDGIEIADGSGLDRSNRTTCAVVSQVLARDGSTGVIASGLADAGRTGTLQRRFVDSPAVGRLEAKTGTLAGVSGLAGWARPDDQQPFDFVVLTNGLDANRARSIEERIALTLVQQPKTLGTARLRSDGGTGTD